LKVAPVNARVGPGEDYKALWTFQAKGVPVQIVETSEDWRRICDPEGGLACKAGWCRINVDHATGWVRADEVWGAADGPQCK
jgi:SH3-like domain-containing protein